MIPKSGDRFSEKKRNTEINLKSFRLGRDSFRPSRRSLAARPHALILGSLRIQDNSCNLCSVLSASATATTASGRRRRGIDLFLGETRGRGIAAHDRLALFV